MKLYNKVLELNKLDKLEETDINITSNYVIDAVKLLTDHIRHGSNILIISDYDADGLTSALIFYEFSQIFSNSHKVDYYILNPFEDRRIEYKDEFKKYDLIITLDCGINSSNFEKEVEYNGQDLIVIDHHKIDSNNVVKSIKVHPTYISGLFDNLSGSGLTYKFCEYFLDFLHLKNVDEIKDIMNIYAGIGTITDMVGVLYGNRKIIKNGYEKLRYYKDKIFLTSIAYPSFTTYLFAYGSILNSIKRVEHLVENYSFNIKDFDINSIKYLYKVKQDTINQIKYTIDIINNNIAIVKLDDPKYLTLLGTIANKILYNSKFNFIIGIAPVSDDEYKITFRGKNKILFVYLFRNLFKNYGGHEYVVSAIVYQDKLDQVINEFNKIVSELEIKHDNVVKLSEVYDEDMYIDLMKLLPVGIDLKLPIICIDRNDIDISRNFKIGSYCRIALTKSLYYNKIILEEV